MSCYHKLCHLPFLLTKLIDIKCLRHGNVSICTVQSTTVHTKPHRVTQHSTATWMYTTKPSEQQPLPPPLPHNTIQPTGSVSTLDWCSAKAPLHLLGEVNKAVTCAPTTRSKKQLNAFIPEYYSITQIKHHLLKNNTVKVR